jgi:hypothetical protein
MQNHNPVSSFFVTSTGVANGDDDCQIIPVDIYCSSHSCNTSNSVLDIEYNGPHIGVSPSFKATSWSIPGQCGGNWPTHMLLNNGRNSWYSSRTTSSRGCSFGFFTSIALLISYDDDSNTEASLLSPYGRTRLHSTSLYFLKIASEVESVVQLSP